MEGLFKQNFEGYLKYQDISQQKKPICVNGLIFDTAVSKTSLKMIHTTYCRYILITYGTKYNRFVGGNTPPS